VRQNFDPVVLRALRGPDELLKEKSKRAFLRGPEWDATRTGFCAALVDSTAVVFHIWLGKLNQQRAEQVRALPEDSLKALADFIAWLVLFCFRLANEVKPETNSVVLTFYLELFPQRLGFTRAGRNFFEDAHTQIAPLNQEDLNNMSEEERWTVEHLTFLRPTVAALARLAGFGELKKQESLDMQTDLGPTLNGAVLHFANAVGVKAAPLVRL
jgi:hypothetical protein